MFSKKIPLTPKLIFAIALMYMASADGIIESEEVTYLSTVMHGDIDKLILANKYIKEAMKKGISFDDFLEESSKILNDSQKECIIVNLIDMMFADGRADEHEEKLLEHIIKKFNFKEEKFNIYKELMHIKNDHTVFSD